MVYCPECGSEITPEDIFCGNCGIALTPIVPVGEDVRNAPISEDEAGDDEARGSGAELAKKSVPGELPAQPAGNENSAPVKDSFDNAALKPEAATEPAAHSSAPIESLTEKTSESTGLTAENWTMQTESVELPPLPVGDGAEEKKQPNVQANQPAPYDWQSGVNNQSAVEEKKFDDPISFSDELTPVSVDHTNDHAKGVSSDLSLPAPGFAVKDAVQPEPLVAVDANDKKSVADNPPVADSKSDKPLSSEETDIDFQATLPYTPNDFANQQAIASKIADEKLLKDFEPSKLPAADSEKFAVSQDAAPIELPKVPVGSSMHDSLEPTLVSVQIYDPKEKPEDVEPETLLNSTEDFKAIVEQAKAEQSAPKENRAFTSPNIGVGDTDGKGKAKLKPLDEGTVLNNRYEVVRKIGGGGMGAVYLASDRNLGGISRAVKEMVQSYIEDSQQEKAVNDFRRESMLLTSLEHPSIPTIYDYFFDDKEARFYLVMKYIAGGDLAARLRSASEGKISEASVTEWGIQLADVLDYLHNRQPPIVYRDLKPSNIMIDGNNGKVMLIDFGIARWVNKEEKGVTAVGTMGYAPPELFSGNVEPRSDIYSLGSTMFHLLTGADPQSNPLLIFDFHKNPRPRQINSQLTDQMEQILMKMVEYNAEKRFASAAELRDTLVIHLDNLKRGNVTTGVTDSKSAQAPAANQPVFCGFCGQKILAADVFCPFCGAQQAAAASKAGSAVFVVPKAPARLVIIGTNELDSPTFSLEKDSNLIGRRDPLSNIFPEVDLSKFDPQTKISRRHARIWRERDSFLVEDLGSSNGTTIIAKNGELQKLGKNQPRLLTNGDKIRAGDTTLYFVSE